MGAKRTKLELEQGCLRVRPDRYELKRIWLAQLIADRIQFRACGLGWFQV